MFKKINKIIDKQNKKINNLEDIMKKQTNLIKEQNEKISKMKMFFNKIFS
jgi:hypothetical protein